MYFNGWAWQGPETYLLLWSNGGHPGNYNDAVRQWRAPGNGTIHITGNVSDSNSNCGTGVIVSIKKGSQLLWQRTIENGDTTGFSYDFTSDVVTGDQINFVINNRGDWGCDSTNFDPTIVYSSSGSLINLAFNKPATQSSEGAWGGVASRAVDGNSDGYWPNNSVTHTYADPQAWWQVDLGDTQSVQSVEIWNRTDCCGDRLTNFNVILLDYNQNIVSSTNVAGQAGTPTTVQISGSARYVKIQLVGTNYLSLAEVRVWGTPNPGVLASSRSTPYGNARASIPGIIESEKFDEGGAEIAYHDTTPGSYGQDYDNPPNYPTPSFRQPTDVDIYKWGYSNGYLVLMQAGDWMNYSVSISQSASYTLEAQVAWGGDSGGNLHIEVDGQDVTGPLHIPGSNWGWFMITKSGVQLPAGNHTMRVVADTNGSYSITGDIDYLRFTKEIDSVQLGRQLRFPFGSISINLTTCRFLITP